MSGFELYHSNEEIESSTEKDNNSPLVLKPEEGEDNLGKGNEVRNDKPDFRFHKPETGTQVPFLPENDNKISEVKGNYKRHLDHKIKSDELMSKDLSNNTIRRSKEGIKLKKNASIVDIKTKKIKAILDYKLNSDGYNLGLNNDNQSLENALLRNPSLPKFLGDIWGTYNDDYSNTVAWYKKSINDTYKTLNIKKENLNMSQGEKIPLLEEYLLENDTQENFEKFLTSDEFINGWLLDYLNSNVDKNGKIYFSANNAISSAAGAWHKHLLSEYDRMYPTGDTNRTSKIKNAIGTVGKIEGKINKTIIDSISDGANLKEVLDQILETQQNYASNMSDSEKEKLKDYNVERLLRESIKTYSRRLDRSNKEHPLQKLNDEQFDLNLRAYLYLYGKQYHPNFDDSGGTLEECEEALNEVLGAILRNAGEIKSDSYNKYLENENALNARMAQAQREARNNAIEWNKRRNGYIGSRTPDHGLHKTNEKSIEKQDLLQNGSGAEIAKNMELGKKLSLFKIKGEPSETEKTYINRVAFRNTCKACILGNNDFKSYITIGDLNNFFIVGENGITFNQEARDKYKLGWLNKNGNNDLPILNKIETVLKVSFPAIFDKTKEGTIDSASIGMGKVDEIIKNHAIGAVIDNIKDMLGGLSKKSDSGQNSKGFEYNDIKIEKHKDGENKEHETMMISGYFKGNNVTIYYDTETGNLSIDSSIHEDANEITVGKNPRPKKIGTIEPFGSILKDFYKTPTDSVCNSFTTPPKLNNNLQGKEQKPKLSPSQLHSRKLAEIETDRGRLKRICERGTQTQIDEIGDIIKDELEKGIKVDGVVYSLFRTLNIFSDDTKEDDINNGGNENFLTTVKITSNTDLFKIVKMVQNADDETLDMFQEIMPNFMESLGLSWGKNNDQQNKEKTGLTTTVFNEKFDRKKDDINEIPNQNETHDEDENKGIAFLRRNSENFDKEKNDNKQNKTFKEEENFGILKILIDKFSKPGFHVFEKENIIKYYESMKAGEELEKLFN